MLEDVIKKYKRQAPYIDVQIQRRVREYFLRRVDQPQHTVASRDPGQHQYQAQGAAGKQGGIDRCFQPSVFPGAT